MTELVARVRVEVAAQLGPNATFEQRREATAALASEVLREAVTTAEQVEVDGCCYRRLAQPSSATYHGRWGDHHIDEALYRQVGVHNGPTIKPIELRAGIVKQMTPDVARIVGELSAEAGSRSVARALRVVGLAPPSRAFIAKRTTELGGEIAGDIERIEQAARDVEELPAAVGSVSCGIDRMAVRMSEPAEGEAARPATRTEPYERTPPPAKDHHYRMAWVGSTSIYDRQGNELHVALCRRDRRRVRRPERRPRNRRQTSDRRAL